MCDKRTYEIIIPKTDIKRNSWIAKRARIDLSTENITLCYRSTYKCYILCVMKERIRVGAFSLAVLRTLSETASGILFGQFAKDKKNEGNHARELARPSKNNGKYHEILKNAPKENLRVTLWRLERKGLIEKKENKYFLSLLGKKFFTNQEQPKQWDGKWRLITFDIPETKRGSRIWLRANLIHEGYDTIQKSVFLGKNPIPRRMIEEMKEREILSCVRLIVIGEIDDNSLLSEYEKRHK